MHDACMHAACSFSNPMSHRDLLTCSDARGLTRCHLDFVSDLCHFFRQRVLHQPGGVQPLDAGTVRGHCNERCLPGHDPDGNSDGFPTPTVICGDAEGSSQFSTERISSRPMATHPQVGLPAVTWRKIPATRPGIRWGFTAMLTA